LNDRSLDLSKQFPVNSEFQQPESRSIETSANVHLHLIPGSEDERLK